MTAHFWMSAGATLGAAAMMGVSLGGYVTSPQSPTHGTDDYMNAAIDDQTASDTSFAVEKGPGAIHCTGCGPTLAERRWQADMAGLDLNAMRGESGDPALRDYEAEQPREDVMPATMPLPVRIVPPQVTRFAADHAPPPVMVTRTGPDGVPPPTLVATTADTQP